MDFDELLAKILHLLQQEQRLSYRALNAARSIYRSL